MSAWRSESGRDHCALAPVVSAGTLWRRVRRSLRRSAATEVNDWWYSWSPPQPRSDSEPPPAGVSAPALHWRKSLSLAWRGVPFSRSSVNREPRANTRPPAPTWRSTVASNVVWRDPAGVSTGPRAAGSTST
jgi:hypothetical protein